MSWAKLDDGFFRHPKARAAGKDGRALFMAGLCWAASHLTDGFIALTDLGLVAAEAEVRANPTARRLVEVGLWESTDDGWVIHDYLVFNPTAEQAREKRRKRAEAGRKGGLRSKPPGTKQEAEVEAIASANAQANGKQNRTPSPYPTEELTSSDGLTTPADPPDDDPDQHLSHDALVGATIAVLAARDLDERQRQDHLRPLGDPHRWLDQAQDERRAQQGQALDALAHQNPQATPAELADLLDPPRPAISGHRRPEATAYDGQQLAARARAEHGQAEARRIVGEEPDIDRNRSAIAGIRNQLPQYATHPTNGDTAA